jgi:putative flippase GtrA
MMTMFFDVIIVKFILVGLFNFFVGMLLMLGLYNIAGYDYWISTGIVYLVGGMASFFLNKNFTFKAKNSGSALIIVVFVFVQFLAYFLAFSIAKPVVFRLLGPYSSRFKDNVSIFVGNCIFSTLNYFGQRFFVFPEKH